MADEITKRYRVRTRPYVCLTPEETVQTGITAGEETVEELTLVRNPGFGYQLYAVIRIADEQELKNISVMERRERAFDNRNEAVNYLKARGTQEYQLCGVKNARIVEKDEIDYKAVGEGTIGKIMQDLKIFDS